MNAEVTLNLKKLKKENKITIGNFSAIITRDGSSYIIDMIVNGKELHPHFQSSKKDAIQLIDTIYHERQK